MRPHGPGRAARFAAVALCALSASCATSPRPQEEPLPFHVAVAPIVRARVEETQREGDLRLELNAEDLTRLDAALVAELGERCFTRATALEPIVAPPSIDPELAALRVARATTDADLLLTLELRHGTGIHYDVGPARSNWLPWWIPGPWFWWLPDIAYGADATLTARFYDLARNTSDEADRPLEVRRWFFDHTSSLTDAELDFLDRAGGEWELYALSFVAPSTALGRTRDGLEVDLRAAFSQRLVETLSAELRSRRGDLERNEVDHVFYLEPSRTTVERLGPQRARVRLSLAHRIGSSRNQPSALGVAGGGELPTLLPLTPAEIDAAFQGRTGSGEHARYVIERTVEVSPGDRTLRVVVRAGRAAPSRREYTLALPPPD